MCCLHSRYISYEDRYGAHTSRCVVGGNKVWLSSSCTQGVILVPSVTQFLLHPGCCISSKCGSVPFCTQGVMLVPSVASSFCTQGVILVPSVAQCLLHPGCYVSCKLYQNKVTSWIGPALVSLVESRQGHWTRSVFINCSASLTMHENEGC